MPFDNNEFHEIDIKELCKPNIKSKVILGEYDMMEGG